MTRFKGNQCFGGISNSHFHRRIHNPIMKKHKSFFCFGRQPKHLRFGGFEFGNRPRLFQRIGPNDSILDQVQRLLFGSNKISVRLTFRRPKITVNFLL